jgi:hypothetical protein
VLEQVVGVRRLLELVQVPALVRVVQQRHAVVRLSQVCLLQLEEVHRLLPRRSHHRLLVFVGGVHLARPLGALPLLLLLLLARAFPAAGLPPLLRPLLRPRPRRRGRRPRIDPKQSHGGGALAGCRRRRVCCIVRQQESTLALVRLY